MRKYGLIGLICLSMMFMGTTASYAGTEAGQVLSVKKNVYVVRDNRKHDAKPQMSVMLKDAVETDEKSRTKLFFTDDSIINLGETSRIVVEEYLYSPEKQRSKSIYRLIDGSLKVVVGRSDLEIHTPTSVAAARGTVIYIGVDRDADGNLFTWMIVTEGEGTLMNLTGVGEPLLLGAGEMGQTTEDGLEKVPFDPAVIEQFEDATIVIGDQVYEPGDPLPPQDEPLIAEGEGEGEGEGGEEDPLDDEEDELLSDSPIEEEDPTSEIIPVTIDLDFQ